MTSKIQLHDTRELDLSIIVVSFNTREMTLACLQSIVDETRDTRYEVIIVDNNSLDGSAEAIRLEFPQFSLISLEENIGFARANNLAAAQANGRKILLLNPDTLVIDNAVDRLLSFANKTSSYQIWGGRTIHGDGSLNPASCWHRITLWSLVCFAIGLTSIFRGNPFFNVEAYAGWNRDTVRHVDIVTGCFLLIDRQLWMRLGGFDPAFFMYGEEADLCYRAKKLGAIPTITPEATIVHFVGASDKVFVERRLKILKGRVTLIRKHFSPLSRRIGCALQASVPLTRWLGYRLIGGLFNRPDLGLLANEWGSIWQRRAEWSSGY